MTSLKSFFRIPKLPDKRRIIALVTFCVAVYSITLSWLAITWYQLDTTVPFHWFDDSRGWLMIDKFGHFFSVYFVASILSKVWRWTGCSPTTCLWIGAGIAFLSHSTYEIFDGFSKGYGASATDILANFLGVSFFIFNYWVWGRMKIFPRLSFHPSVYAHLRPLFFGDTFIQQLLKDYNGHTFWFSLDINALTGRKLLPSWMLISVGYGADGILGGDDNIWEDKSGKVHDYSHIVRSTRWMLSLDINWNVLEKSRFKFLSNLFIYIKTPMPTLEINYRGLRWHWFYF